MFKFITGKPLWVNILAGLILAIVLFSLVVSSLGWITNHNDAKTVPAVLGKSLREAQQIIDKAGFKVEIQDSVYIDTLRPLQVIRQVPDEYEVVKSNRTIYLTINRAVPPLIEMPTLTGISMGSALQVLKSSGLKLGDTTFKPDFAINTVLEQQYNGMPIQPGAKIRMGSVISLVIGSGLGNKTYSVPNLVGMTYGQAKVLVDSMGIGFGAVIQYPDVTDQNSAYIYRQMPDKFDEEGNVYTIRQGQLIDIWLSATPPISPLEATDSSSKDKKKK